MPSKGYETIGLKPAILKQLQIETDKYYPGMFVPSALIMMMNEVKRGDYYVKMHNIKIDFSGSYTSLTMRSDVKVWLEENYNNLIDEYAEKYKIRNFTRFVSVFLINMFESKRNSQQYIIKLKESDFRWLEEEYKKRKEEYKLKYNILNFDNFADFFVKELLKKFNAAKEILTI